MPLSSGARLGPYEIVAPLGAGGMGEVYRARDTRLGRDVALKVLAAHVTADADRMRRFAQEARSAAALNHPNILAVFDVSADGTTPYLVSELLEGHSLRELLESGPLPPRRAVDYAVQIARGLAAAHEKGIVHRDLKPENLFITSDGRVKILDFGLAKVMSTESRGAETTLATAAPGTNPGVVMGTVGYMAPEQVRGQAVDHRADLFAFGAVLYEMLTGRRAFQRDTSAETMTAILKEEPPAVPESGGQVSPGLQRIVAHCLEKQPSLRFKSADDLAFALDALSSSTLTPAAGAAAAVATEPARRSRSAVVAVAAAMLAALVAAAVTWSFRPPPVAPQVYRFNITPPPDWRFAVPAAPDSPLAVSPDGRSVVALGINGKGQTALWLRNFDAFESRVLAGTEGAGNTFFWSPDSRSLAFMARGKLSRLDLATGAVTYLADVGGGSLGGAWNRTDQILIASYAGFYRLRASGGTPEREQTLAADETLLTNPIFFPDGEHYLISVTLGNEIRAGAPKAIDIAKLGEAKRTRLLTAEQFAVPVAVAAGHMLLMRGNRLVAQKFDDRSFALSGDPVTIADRVQLIATRPYPVLSAEAGGGLAYVAEQQAVLHQLAWYDRTGKRLSNIGEPGDYSNLDLSPDGTRLAVAVMEPGQRTRDIWTFDLTRGVRTRFTFGTGEERTAVWWPDGNRLIYNSQRKTTERELYDKLADGTGSERVLLADGLSKDPLGVSPDGKVLLYRESGRNGNDVMAMPFDGKPYPIAATPADESLGKFSPDGRWIAYTTTETGQREIYVVPSSPEVGGRWQISTNGGDTPRWRGDGRELYFVGQDLTIMATTVDGSGPGFRIGATTPLFNVPLARQIGYQYSVARDGQRFIANVESAASAYQIVVVSDWRTMIK